MSKDRRFNGRKDAERDEGYKTIDTGLPSERFNSEKQIVTPDEMGVTKDSTPTSVTNRAADAAVMLKSKIKLRPDVSVEDLGGKQVGGVPLAVDTNLRNVAGARKVSPADDMSRTPYSAGEYRPKTAYGKKRSDDLFELDNAATEQVVPIVEDCPDLKAAPDSTFVYNGRQQFKQVRQKKNFKFVNYDGHNPGKLPQHLLNDASLDFETENKVIYSSGQVVQPIMSDGSIEALPKAADYPVTDGKTALATGDALEKGNYLPRNLRITVSDGHISSVTIDEERYISAAHPVVRDEANFNWQVDANNVAKTMIKIQKEMGRETTDKWTPLAYVINSPYEFNMLLHDIEATCGANMAAAYRAAVSSLAYQRNIVKKDGINPQRNAIKMIYEGFAGTFANNDRNTISDLDFQHVLFNQGIFKKGAATAIIDMFDSTKKYRTKADILGLQRSFGLHLAQADNNINPLRCKPQFIKLLNKAHLFSTIDGKYNAFLPIYQTKEIKVMNPMSLNFFLKGWKNPVDFTDADRRDPRRDQTTGTYATYMYEYNDLRNNVYKTRVQMPMIEGLLMWLLKHEGAFVATFGNGETVIPWTYNVQAPALLDFFLCSSAQDIAFQRNICFRDVLFAGDQETYIWDDLDSLEHLDPLFSTQMKINKYDQPLDLGTLSPDSAVRLMYRNRFQLGKYQKGAIGTHAKVSLFAPWYMNEQAFSGDYTLNSGFFDADTPYAMSMPSIRDGVRHEHIDLIKSMKIKDVALSLDRYLDVLPFVTVSNEKYSDNTDKYVMYTPVVASGDNGDKIKVSAVRYDSNSDGRIMLTYDLDEGSNYPLHAVGHYCIPKELGLIDDDYTGISVITGVSASYNSSTHEYDVTITKSIDDFETTDTYLANSIFYDGGSACWVTSYRVEGDSFTQTSIDRSAALTGTFYNFFATQDSTIKDCNDAFVENTGLVLTRSYNGGQPESVPGVYNLHSDHESTAAISVQVQTDAQYYWTLMQRFMMPVNPFANAYALVADNDIHDPFEACYLFGICGFLSADYTQHVLERLSIYDQLGFDYTEDTNYKESLILR